MQFNSSFRLISRMYRLAIWITIVTMKTDHCTRASINVMKLPVQVNIIQDTQQHWQGSAEQNWFSAPAPPTSGETEVSDMLI